MDCLYGADFRAKVIVIFFNYQKIIRDEII